MLLLVGESKTSPLSGEERSEELVIEGDDGVESFSEELHELVYDTFVGDAIVLKVKNFLITIKEHADKTNKKQ